MIGIDKFKEYFKGHESEYVIIGGAACELLMEDEALVFRATKDIDMVIIVESLTKEFGEKFWSFIKDGGYQFINKGTGKAQFYRFSHPSFPEYPFMIELFSRRPDWILENAERRIVPVHFSESVSSLSAILLDDDYYNFLKSGTKVISGLSILCAEHIIPFKVKAWLDLNQRRQGGEQVDSKNIKKHKNDIFRLSQLITPSQSIFMSDILIRDMEVFLEAMKEEDVDLKQIGIIGVDKFEIIELIYKIYNIKETIAM